MVMQRTPFAPSGCFPLLINNDSSHLLLDNQQLFIPPPHTSSDLWPFNSHSLIKVILTNCCFSIAGPTDTWHEPDPRGFISAVGCQGIFRISSRTADVFLLQFPKPCWPWATSIKDWQSTPCRPVLFSCPICLITKTSTLQCPPYSCRNPVIPVESSGIQWSPVESSGMGPDSSGFHRIADWNWNRTGIW